MARSERQPLNRERVIEAALALVDEHGLSALSMRRLAGILGVEAMSLYNHVSNKAEILDGIAELIFAGIPLPPADLPWPERIRGTARTIYDAFGQHPAVAKAVVTDQANVYNPAGFHPVEVLFRALAEGGFDDVAIRRALKAISALIFGTLALATNGFTAAAGAATEEAQFAPFLDKIDSARQPRFAQVMRVLASGDAGEDFDHALDLLVVGLVDAAERGRSSG